jgi:two-component sensor histidine kinase
MHHRVRNNLQTVAALLSMQARHAEDAGWTAPLQEAVSRIRSIAVIHDLLSSGNLGETTADTIARHVAEEAGSNIVPPGLHITFVIPPSDVRVPSRQATVLALLINEFVTNAVFHGFAARSRGRLEISIRAEDRSAVLEVIDDGVGLPESFELPGGAGLGLQIARTLAEADLGGTLEVARRPGGGTVVRVRFTPNRPTGMS